VKYGAKDLGYVVKDAMDITSFGKNVFELITKEGASQYFAGVLVGGKTLLKLIGAIEGDSGEENVSNADLSEDIRELHSLLNGMSNRLDEGVKQIYQNRLTPSTTLSAPSTWSAPRWSKCIGMATSSPSNAT
jgi:hypothetical protein